MNEGGKTVANVDTKGTFSGTNTHASEGKAELNQRRKLAHVAGTFSTPSEDYFGGSLLGGLYLLAAWRRFVYLLSMALVIRL